MLDIYNSLAVFTTMYIFLCDFELGVIDVGNKKGEVKVSKSQISKTLG